MTEFRGGICMSGKWVRVPLEDGDEVVDLFVRIRLGSSIGFWLCRAVHRDGRLFIAINALPFC